MTETDWTPLFLLRTVLFPKALLGLRIFEPRYLDMISASLRQGRDFGICLSHSWGDGHAEPELEGTLARIVDWGGEAGVFPIQVEGRERFTLQGWGYDGPLAGGSIHRWGAWAIVPRGRENHGFAPILGDLIGQGHGTEVTARSARMNLAQALPASPEEKQQLLVIQDPMERLRRIADLLGQHGGA